MILDATNLIVGRLASFAAKKALLGERIDIINCDNAVISGKKEHVISEYKRKKDMGTHIKGPFYFRTSDRFVKRTIRGMLNYKKERGKKALKRIKCYTNLPTQFKDKKMEIIPNANVSKIKNLNHIKLKKLLEVVCGR